MMSVLIPASPLVAQAVWMSDEPLGEVLVTECIFSNNVIRGTGIVGSSLYTVGLALQLDLRGSTLDAVLRRNTFQGDSVYGDLMMTGASVSGTAAAALMMACNGSLLIDDC